MVEDLGFTRLGLGNQAIVQDIEDILADILQLGLNLLAIVTDGRDMLLGTLGLLLLLDGGDYAPRGTASTNNVLVGDREEVSLVYRKFTAELCGQLGCDQIRDCGARGVPLQLPLDESVSWRM